MNKMNFKRSLALLLVLALCMMTFAGCGRKIRTGGINVYYLNISGTGLVTYPYELKETKTMERVKELLDQLADAPESDDFTTTIPATLKVEDMSLNDAGELSLYFGRDYSNLTGVKEALIRSAIVRTLLQVTGVVSVSFFISGDPLTDDKGNVIGPMTTDSFIDYADTSNSAMEKATLTLFYASADGQHLVRENRAVYYSSNVASEKLVLEYLMQKPQTKDALIPIPDKTKIINVAVNDGICYVNLDSTFLTTMDNVSPQVSVYAIVDSLCQLDQINKVQISVDGETESILGNGQHLNSIYEPDSSLIAK